MWKRARIRKLALLLVAPLLLAGCMQNVRPPPSIFPDAFGDNPRHVDLTLNAGLRVSNEPFLVKGIVYAPIPAGLDPKREAWDWVAHPQIYEGDFALMKKLGANTVRVVNASLDGDGMRRALDVGESLRLKFILGIGGVLARATGDPEAAQAARDHALEIARAYKGHPAVLMWIVGEEAANQPGATLSDAQLDLLDDVVNALQRLDPHHPVAAVASDADAAARIRARVPAIDALAVPLHVTGSEADALERLLEVRAAAADRPLLVSALSATAHEPNAPAHERLARQAEAIRAGWQATLAAQAVGASIFEFTDEWWKSGAPDKQDDAPDEHLGLAAIALNSTQRQLRPAYFTLQKAWKESSDGDLPGFLRLVSETNGNRLRVIVDVLSAGDVPVNVTLEYRMKSGEWTRTPMRHADNDTWYLDLGPYEGMAIVFFRVRATDESGRESVSHQDTARAIPAPPVLLGLAVLSGAALGLGASKRPRKTAQRTRRT